MAIPTVHTPVMTDVSTGKTVYTKFFDGKPNILTGLFRFKLHVLLETPLGNFRREFTADLPDLVAGAAWALSTVQSLLA